MRVASGTIGLMLVVFASLIVGVSLAVVVVSLGRGDVLGDDAPGTAVPLPDGPVSATDLGQLRFVIAARGYRMDQVDATLDRLGEELADRDGRIAWLESQLALVAGDASVRDHKRRT